MYYMSRVVSTLALSTLIAAAIWSALLARADVAFRKATPQAVAQVMRRMPGNTAYLAFGALQAEYDGRDSSPLLERIALLNPTNSASRIRLGLAAEQRGDSITAERWLREAFAVDHQFETRWTLANFYLRQNRTEEFWTWIRSALEISYGDRRPAFDLCWRVSSDASEILARAIPDRQAVASDYLVYLLEHQHLDALVAAASKVRDQNWLHATTDALLDTKRYADAVQVWRQTGRPAPDGITGPNFEAPQTGHGFDWRPISQLGVRHLSPGRIGLSGEQPESVELLRQFVGGLRLGARYRLQWKASPEVPGIGWRIDGQATTEFRASAEVALLSLWYQRPSGEVRATATFRLSGVTLLTLH
jgi:tetratricopeptide (TPR) repeat protein